MSKETLHLFTAIKEKRLEQVKVALKNDQSLVNTKDSKGMTPLLLAAQGPDADIVDALIKHGAHINYQQPEKGSTALMLAAQNARLHIVKYLIARGADIMMKDNHGKTALDYAQQSKNKDLIELLEQEMNI
jgi:ankyrin repeat protein